MYITSLPNLEIILHSYKSEWHDGTNTIYLGVHTDNAGSQKNFHVWILIANHCFIMVMEHC